MKRCRHWFTASVFGLAGAMALVIVLLLYLQFNVVGNTKVEGLQGRYFLPLLILCAAFWPVRAGPRAQTVIERVVGCFAVASAATTLLAVASAYWVL